MKYGDQLVLPVIYAMNPLQAKRQCNPYISCPNNIKDKKSMPMISVLSSTPLTSNVNDFQFSSKFSNASFPSEFKHVTIRYFAMFF